jgi:hypothetical protein
VDVEFSHHDRRPQKVCYAPLAQSMNRGGQLDDGRIPKIRPVQLRISGLVDTSTSCRGGWIKDNGVLSPIALCGLTSLYSPKRAAVVATTSKMRRVMPRCGLTARDCRRHSSAVLCTRQRHCGTAVREQCAARHRTITRLLTVADVASE